MSLGPNDSSLWVLDPWSRLRNLKRGLLEGSEESTLRVLKTAVEPGPRMGERRKWMGLLEILELISFAMGCDGEDSMDLIGASASRGL